MSNLKLVAAFVGACVLSFMAGRVQFGATPVQAQERAFTALDYQEITQLINRYAYGIDTCANNGYDYADVFTPDGVFIDKNSDAGFKAGGRVLAKGRDALATLVGGGITGLQDEAVWTDWSHLMLNHRDHADAEGATGRIYLRADGHERPGHDRASWRLRGRLRADCDGLAHQVAHARARQGVAQPAAADGRSELTRSAVLRCDDVQSRRLSRANRMGRRA